MNCCDRILILFLAFCFAQFSFRWESDKELARAPWQIQVSGTTNKTSPKTSTFISFNQYAISYGSPTSKVADTHIYSNDRQEVFILIKVSVTGPPMSFHRIQLRTGNKIIQELSLFVSNTGESHGSMYVQAIHAPLQHMRVNYLFDGTWNIENKAKASVQMVICSGHPFLWDVKWHTVYKSN